MERTHKRNHRSHLGSAVIRIRFEPALKIGKSVDRGTNSILPKDYLNWRTLLAGVGHGVCDPVQQHLNLCLHLAICRIGVGFQ